MTPDEITGSLSACIERARRNHPEIIPENDFYWYTREKCVEICMDRKISIGSMLLKLNKWKWDSDQEISCRSDPFWDQVQHPELLIRDVLES